MRTSLLLLVASARLALAAELPVRQVILYKHGVGFFGRSGEVKPGDTARLDFKAADMNDVLKSLTVFDRANGKVNGVRYDSSQPLAAKLGEFPFAIEQESSLAALLDQCKGAHVEMQFGNNTYAGQIVSARRVTGKDGAETAETVTLLLDSGEFRTFGLGGSLKFTDPELQKRLREYLNVMNAARSQEKRSIYIDAPGSGARTLDVSYMAPSPVWKSSYRLLLQESGEPTLEGWAIVDNTTGEDWENVSLALVSGRPISFISPLYEARYRSRATVDLPDEGAATPTIYEGEVMSQNGPLATPPPPPRAELAPMAPRPMAKAGMGTGSGAGIGGIAGGRLRQQQFARDGAVMMDAVKEVSGAPAAGSSVNANAEGRDVGELFEYRFSTPVTVRKTESAMLPFLQGPIKARKLLVYSLENTSLHPQNAAELINTAGKTLDGGPITVYEARTYAGEALIDTLKTGDKRLIGYSVDLGTRVTTKFDSDAQTIREIHASRGILQVKTALQETKTFTIRNVDPKAKTLLIETPVRPGYKLLNQKPTATSSSAYRFEVKLDPEKLVAFPVSEERILENSYMLSNLTPDVLGGYVSNKALSDAGRRQLQQIVTLKNQIAELDEQSRTNDAEINTFSTDQNRIRENISSLNRVSGQQDLVQKYASTLASQEVRLASLRDRQTDLRNRRSALQTQLNQQMERLEF